MAVLKYKDKNGQWKSIASGGSNSGGGNVNVDLSRYATKQELDKKVDKVSGKQLSTEDFTTLLKQKLEGLSNYNDTNIRESVLKLRTDLDTLVSGDTTTAIKTFNEVIAFLDGITDTQDLESIIASIEQQIATKQDKISDLATIRQGAAKGATALLSYTEKYTGTYSKPSGGIPKSDLASAIQISLGKADTALQTHQDISGKADKSSLAAVATSGSYNDLTGKPTVDTALSTSSTNAVQNKVVTASINAKYTKPSTGIPKSDLTSAVLTSLSKADTALQSHQDISGKLDKLVSGTNIKTINGNPILGSGDIKVATEALKFKNITASSWTADSTYANFGYVCNLSCSGVTEDMYAEVVFNVAQATSGNYAPVCETGSGIVKIWSSTNDSITIPVIIIHK